MSYDGTKAPSETHQLLEAYLVIEPERAYIKAYVEVDGQPRYFAIDVDPWRARDIHNSLVRLRKPSEPEQP